MKKEKSSISPWMKAVFVSIISASLFLFAWSSIHNRHPEKEDATPSLQPPLPNSAVISLTQEEKAWLRDHPVIRVAQDPDWPPIEFADDQGNPSGMSEDYLKLIEQRLGISFERVKGLAWQDAYSRLKQWDIDMTTSIASTPDRMEFWAFTEPYLNLPIVILAGTDVTYIHSIDHLEEKKIAVVDGYVAGEWMQRDFPNIRLVKVKTVRQGLDLLQKGDVFAFVDNMLVVDYYIAKLKISNLKIVGQTPYINAQCMAVRKDWAPLAGILQKVLGSITEEEHTDIFMKWAPIREDRRGMDYGIFLQFLGAFALILTGLILWNRRLSREITSRKKAETALKEEEARFRRLFEAAVVPLCFIDKDGRLIDSNKWFTLMFGYTRDDVPTMAEWWRLAYPDPDYRTWVIDTWNNSVHRAAEEKTDIEPAEYNVTCKDGRSRSVLISGTLIDDDILAAFSDVTEQRRVEKNLRHANELILSILESTSDGYVAWDYDWRYTYINAAAEGMLGYPRDKIMGLDMRTVDSPLQNAAFERRFEFAMNRHENVGFEEYDARSAMWLEVRAYPAVNGGLSVYFRDITEQKLAQKTLRYHDMILRDMGRIAKIGGWEFDPATGKGTWTEEVARIHDLDPKDETNVQRGLTFYKGDSLAKIESAVKEVVESGKPYDLELELVSAKGIHKWVRAMADPIVENGKIIQIKGAFQDITAQKQAEEELRSAHERIRRFIDANIVGVVIADPYGKIIEANDYYLNLIGYTRDEFNKGMVNWRSITPPEWLSADENAIKELREKGTCVPYEKEYIRRDGTRVPIFLADAMLPGKEEHIAAFALDLTKQKKIEEALRESEELYRNILTAAPVGIAVQSEGKIVFTNPAGLRLLGADSTDRLVGKPISEIIHPDYLESTLLLTQRLIDGEKGLFPAESVYLKLDGTPVNVEVMASLITFHGRPAVQVIVTDITERKAAQDEIYRLNADLENRIAVRTQQLQEANMELEAFAYSVSHDLRAPLRAIDGYIRIFLEDYRQYLDDEGIRLCSVVSNSARDMGKLIEDLLTFSRMGRTEIVKSGIDMTALAKSVYNELATESQREMVSLTIDSLPDAFGDPALIRQVWVNLISNALKFSSKKERPIIEISFHRQRHKVIYSIRDNGAGFDIKYIDKLFGVFQRLHSVKEYEGTGVGLAIARRIINRHGGVIWGNGETDKGATFYFTLGKGD